MEIIKKHFKKSDSWLHCYFVAHDGFGLKPRLKIGFIDRSGLYFYFLFTFWRFEIYRCRVKKVTDYEQSIEKAYEAYPLNESNRLNHNWNAKRVGFQQGYEQAEKDLELTWEDMMIIHNCIKDAMNFHLYKMMEGLDGQKIVYQEVLKRFKAQKGKLL